LKTLIIRTSDRGLFKNCRTKWDFQSPLRKGYQYIGAVNENFFMGSAMHYAMQYFYDKEYWVDDPYTPEYELLCDRSFEAFNKYIYSKETKKLYDKQLLEKLYNLGFGILNNYYVTQGKHDILEWIPYAPETEFEIELDPTLFNLDPDKYKVLYQGTIDLIAIRRLDETLWIWDHKTFGTEKTNYTWLFLDTQFSTYLWAMKKLGLKVEGLIYNGIYKGFPQTPRILNSGKLSKAKNQNTTYDLFVETLKETKQKAKPYLEYLDFLKQTEKTYIVRHEIQRTNIELKIEENQLHAEIKDMLDNPSIYNSVSEWKCHNCEFLEPCILRLSNKDQWFLDKSKFYRRGD